MRITRLTYKILLITLFKLFAFDLLFSQEITLNAPKLEQSGVAYSFMCSRSSADVFPVSFSFSGAGFNQNNVFYIELSDAQGNFDTPKNLKIITGENNSYYVETSVTVPAGTYGSGYKMRVRSTDPEITSEGSEVFAAYDLGKVKRPVLNDGNDVALCGGGSVEISVDDPTKTYLWYKNGVLQPGLSGASIEVNSPGTYSAKPDYGPCISIESNQIQVTGFDADNVTIQGDDQVSICVAETYTFSTNLPDSDSFYFQWYFNGEQIDGVNSSSYTTSPNPDQFGEYYVKVIPSGGDESCGVTSQKVVLSQLGEGFEASLEVDFKVVLPGQFSVLKIPNELQDATVSWYRNGEVFYQDVPETEIAINLDGVYYAEITENGGACPYTVKTNEVELVIAEDLKITIAADEDYIACSSTEATFSLIDIQAVVGDKEYVLEQSQIDQYEIDWFSSSQTLTADIIGVESFDNGIKINSHVLNGEITARIETNKFTAVSNSIALKLLSQKFEIVSSSESNAICPDNAAADNSILLTISPEPDENTVVQWLKDGVEIESATTNTLTVNEVAVYSVRIDAYGCESVLEVEIKEFDDSIVNISPENVILGDNPEVVVASGADSYEWMLPDGTILSSNEELTIETEGTYVLIAKVGACTVEKEITAITDDGKIIVPNILSPLNNDGVNDYWKVPNRFTKKEVQVIIYNTQGKEILNTFEYKNNWPLDPNSVNDGMIFYYKIIKNDKEIKAGTISVIN